MPLTTVIFDLGGVLVKVNWDRATGPLAEMSGLTTEDVWTTAGDAGSRFMLGDIGPAEFHQKLTARLGVTLDRQTFFGLWSSVISLNDGVGAVVESLAGRYRLAIGSNTDPIHYARCIETQDGLRHFDGTLLSYELRRAKPDLEFFRLGLGRISVDPNECVFIDDKEENVEAARTLGINGVQFSSIQQLETDLAGLA